MTNKLISQMQMDEISIDTHMLAMEQGYEAGHQNKHQTFEEYNAVKEGYLNSRRRKMEEYHEAKLIRNKR